MIPIGTSMIGSKYSRYEKITLKKGPRYCVARISFAITAEVRCNLTFFEEKSNQYSQNITLLTALYYYCCCLVKLLYSARDQGQSEILYI